MRKVIFVLMTLVATMEISHQQAEDHQMQGDDDHGVNPYPDVLPTNNCQSLPDYFDVKVLNNLSTHFGCSFEFVRAESMYKDVSRRSLYQFFRTQSGQLANGSCPLCTGGHSPLYEPDIHYSNIFLMRQNWFLEYSAHFLFAKYRCPFNMSAKIVIEDLPDFGNNNLGTLPEMAGCESYFVVTSMRLRPDEKQEESVAFLAYFLTTWNDTDVAICELPEDLWIHSEKHRTLKVEQYPLEGLCNFSKLFFKFPQKVIDNPAPRFIISGSDYSIASASHYGCAIIVKDNASGISGLGEALQNDRVAYLACLFTGYDSLVSYRGDLNDYTCDHNYGLAEYINSVHTTLCMHINIELIPQSVPFDIACEEKYVDTEITQPTTISAELLTPSTESAVVSTNLSIPSKASTIISSKQTSTILERSSTEWIAMRPRKGRTETKPVGISMSKNEKWRMLKSQWPDLPTKPLSPSTESEVISPEWTGTISEGSEAKWMTGRPGKGPTKSTLAGISTSENVDLGMWSPEWPDLSSESAVPFTETSIRTFEKEGYGMQNSRRSDLHTEPPAPSTEITIVSTERTVTTFPDTERRFRSEKGQTKTEPTGVSTSKNEDRYMRSSQWPNLSPESGVSFTETRMRTSESDWHRIRNSQRPDLPPKPHVSSSEITTDRTVTISPNAGWITVSSEKGRTKARPAGISSFENEEWEILNSPLPNLTTKSTVSSIETTISPEQTATVSVGSNAEWVSVRRGEGPTKATQVGISTSESEKWEMSNLPQPDLTTKPIISSAETTIISAEWTTTKPRGSDTEWITVGPGAKPTKAKPTHTSTSENEEGETQNSQRSDLLPVTLVPSTGAAMSSPERGFAISKVSDAEWTTITSAKERMKAKPTWFSMSENEERETSRRDLTTRLSISSAETTIISPELTNTISEESGAEGVTAEREEGPTRATPIGISASKIEKGETQDSQGHDLASAPKLLQKTTLISPEWTSTIFAESDAERITVRPGEGSRKATPPVVISTSQNEEWVTPNLQWSDLPAEPAVPFTETRRSTSDSGGYDIQNSQRPDLVTKSTETSAIFPEHYATITEESDAEWTTFGPGEGTTKATPVAISTSKIEDWLTRDSQPADLARTVAPRTGTAVFSPEWTGAIPTESDAEWLTITSGKWRTWTKPAGTSPSENEDWGVRNPKRPDLPTEPTVPLTGTEIRSSESVGHRVQISQQPNVPSEPPIPSTEITTASTERTVTFFAVADWITIGLAKGRMKAKPTWFGMFENEEWEMSELPRQDLTTRSSTSSAETTIIPPELTTTISEGSARRGEGLTEATPVGISSFEVEEGETQGPQEPDLASAPKLLEETTIISPERANTILAESDAKWTTVIPEEGPTRTNPGGTSVTENEEWSMRKSKRPHLPAEPAVPFTETRTSTSENEEHGIQYSQWPDLHTDPPVSTGFTIVFTGRAVTTSSEDEEWQTKNSQGPDHTTKSTISSAETATIIPPKQTATISEGSNAEWVTVRRGGGPTKATPVGISTSGDEARQTRNSQGPDITGTPVSFQGTTIISPEWTNTISAESDEEWMTITSGKWRTRTKAARTSKFENEEWKMQNWQRPDDEDATMKPATAPMEQSTFFAESIAVTKLPVPITEIKIISPERTFTVSDAEWITIGSTKGRTEVRPVGFSMSKNDEWDMRNSQQPGLITRSSVPSTETETGASEHEPWSMQYSQQPDLPVKPPTSSTATGTFPSERTSEGSDAKWLPITYGDELTNPIPAGVSSSEKGEWAMPNSQRPNLPSQSSLPFVEIAIISAEKTSAISEGPDAKWTTVRPGEGTTKAIQAGMSASESEDWRIRYSQRPVLFAKPPIPLEEVAERTSTGSEESDVEWITVRPGQGRTKAKPAGGTTSQFEEQREQPTWVPDVLPRDRFEVKYVSGLAIFMITAFWAFFGLACLISIHNLASG